jgi:hypothetical protein
MDNNVVIVSLFAILAIILLLGFTIVPEGSAFIIERFGKYCSTWRKGLHYKLPLIYKISNKISLKEQVYNFSSHSLITRDRIVVRLDAVIYFQIVYPKLYNYEVDNPTSAVENISSASIKDVIGDLTQDYILSSREAVNSKIEFILNEAVHSWGIKITRVNVKNIMLPGEHLGVDTRKRDLEVEKKRRANVLDQMWNAAPAQEVAPEPTVLTQEDTAVFVSQPPISEPKNNIPKQEKEPKNNVFKQVSEIQETFINDLNEADMRYELGLVPDYAVRAESVFAVQKALANTLDMLKSTSKTDKILANKMLDLYKAVTDGRATEDVIPT